MTGTHHIDGAPFSMTGLGMNKQGLSPDPALMSQHSNNGVVPMRTTPANGNQGQGGNPVSATSNRTVSTAPSTNLPLSLPVSSAARATGGTETSGFGGGAGAGGSNNNSDFSGTALGGKGKGAYGDKGLAQLLAFG